MASAMRPSFQCRRMYLGSSSTSLRPRTVSVEGRESRKYFNAGYTSRFIPSGDLSTTKTSGSNTSAALEIKPERRSLRDSKPIDILLDSHTWLATFTAEGSFTMSTPHGSRKASDTVEPVRIKALASRLRSTKAPAKVRVRRRCPSPYESCEYIRIFMLPRIL